MTFEELLAKQAENQLKSTVAAVSNSAWLESLVGKIKDNVGKLDVDEDFKKSTHIAADLLLNNKDKISGLGEKAFTLFLQQIAAGKQQQAADTYVQAVGTVDQIILDMDTGTRGLIAAKKKLDQWYQDAWEIIKTVTITGARLLLPFALALL